MTKTNALVVVAVILALSAGYADYRVFAISSDLTASQRATASNERSTTQALCTFRADLQRRYTSGVQFLLTHPKGILGIPAGTLRVSIQNEGSTLKALRPLVC